MGSFEDAKRKAGIHKAQQWLRARSKTEKVGLATLSAVLALVLLYVAIEDHDTLFVMAEAVHFVGIGFLAYKLVREQNCAGLSLKTQHLTAIFLTIRLYCSFMMEYDIHTLLDLLTLLATVWVIYTMHFKLHGSYNQQMDTLHVHYILVPCAMCAVVAHPSTSHFYLNRVLWALCVYVEAVSVLPQLRMMQKAKVVERFTANYVFALGVARFLSCAHWILQVFDGESYLATAIGSGLWPVMVLFSEVVQTFILADFCYYYMISSLEGGSVVRLPAGLV